MELKLERPIIFLDIEATGLNPRLDKIIQIALIKVFPDNRRENYSCLINPEMPIPQDIVRMTKISQEDVEKEETFFKKSEEIFDFLKGCDLAGFNLLRFDLLLLQEEFRRAKIKFEWDGINVIDVQKIFHKKEPRNLHAAFRFYCDKEMSNPHDALVDAQATLEILESQLERYSDLPKVISELAVFCKEERFVDNQGRLHWKDGEVAIGFGKYKGKLLRELVGNSKDYLNWIVNSDFPEDTKKIIKEALRGNFIQKD